MKKIKIFNSQEEVKAYYVDGVIPSGDLVITRTEKSIATTTNNLDGITEYISGEGGSISVDVPTKLSQLENDTNFITAEDVEQIVPEIPTKVSELENDTNFITAEDVEQIVPAIPTKVSELENDSNFITDSQLSDYATIQIVEGVVNGESQQIYQKFEDYATKDFVQSEIENASIGGDVDLSEYAKLIDIPTVPTTVSSFENDTNYQTSSDVSALLDNYVDKVNAITMTATLEDDSTISFTIYGEQQ